MQTQSSVSRSRSVGTLACGRDILELFAEAGPELLQNEISQALELPLPTVHRLTTDITARRFLERDPQTSACGSGSKSRD
jgi:DNA-binding IclR family transcriptional regulator